MIYRYRRGPEVKFAKINSWEPVYITSKLLKIKINFTEPILVSSNKKSDLLKLEFLDK